MEKDHQSSEIISLMGKCLDFQKILDKGIYEMEFNAVGTKSLEKVSSRAGYDVKEKKTIIE